MGHRPEDVVTGAGGSSLLTYGAGGTGGSSISTPGTGGQTLPPGDGEVLPSGGAGGTVDGVGGVVGAVTTVPWPYDFDGRGGTTTATGTGGTGGTSTTTWISGGSGGSTKKTGTGGTGMMGGSGGTSKKGGAGGSTKTGAGGIFAGTGGTFVGTGGTISGTGGIVGTGGTVVHTGGTGGMTTSTSANPGTIGNCLYPGCLYELFRDCYPQGDCVQSQSMSGLSVELDSCCDGGVMETLTVSLDFFGNVTGESIVSQGGKRCYKTDMSASPLSGDATFVYRNAAGKIVARGSSNISGTAETDVTCTNGETGTIAAGCMPYGSNMQNVTIGTCP
jgi:hypothetical protein